MSVISVIDAHQHYWRLARGDYGWLTPQQGLLYRDFEPEHLRQDLKDCRVTATVVVQAAPTEAETRFLIELSQTHPEIRGIVGWVNFEAPDDPHARPCSGRGGRRQTQGLEADGPGH